MKLGPRCVPRGRARSAAPRAPATQVENVEAIAETLEELWLSYNVIEKLVRACCGLRRTHEAARP